MECAQSSTGSAKFPHGSRVAKRMECVVLAPALRKVSRLASLHSAPYSVLMFLRACSQSFPSFPSMNTLSFSLTSLLCATTLLRAAEPPTPTFRSVEIDSKIEIGYGLAVADVD